jgi:eukaryotic-like serine/threonine-protein kinase
VSEPHGPAAHRLRPGDLVRGVYVVERELGSGAFGTVYRVRHRLLGHQAMKVYRLADAARVADALGEARLLMGLAHPNLIRMFDANTVDGARPEPLYMTMEYVDGGTLWQTLEVRVRLSVAEAVSIARQVCAGLAVAHASSPPIVHRDVKPQNILMARDRAKLGDFGLACQVDPHSLMARSGGTLGYVAPEAAWGFHTPASDVYSIGVVLFRMLTGMPPQPAGPATGHWEPPPPSRFRLGIGGSLDELVLRALAREPADRFASAVDLEAALGNLREGGG